MVNERIKITTFQGKTKKFKNIKFRLSQRSIKILDRIINPYPFVPSNSDKRNEICNEIFNIQIAALAKRFEYTGVDKGIIGVSGGLDSTLALLVTVETFNMLGINRKNIIAVTMPGFGTSGITFDNAIKLIEELGVTMMKIDIKEACNKHFSDIGHDGNKTDLTYENTQARERTQILMDIATMKNGMVIGTGDLSELALGWCTYNGDHMSMYSINASIPKTLVKYLIEWVAENYTKKLAGKVLKKILNTPISPELLPTK